MRRDLSALQPPSRGAGLAGALPQAPRTTFSRPGARADDSGSAAPDHPGPSDSETVSSRETDPRNRPVVLYLPASLAQRLATLKETAGHSYAELVLAAFDAHHDLIEGQLVTPRRSALPPARTQRRRTEDGMRTIQLRLSALELRVIDKVAEEKRLNRSVLLSAVLQRYLDTSPA